MALTGSQRSQVAGIVRAQGDPRYFRRSAARFLRPQIVSGRQFGLGDTSTSSNANKVAATSTTAILTQFLFSVTHECWNVRFLVPVNVGSAANNVPAQGWTEAAPPGAAPVTTECGFFVSGTFYRFAFNGVESPNLGTGFWETDPIPVRLQPGVRYCGQLKMTVTNPGLQQLKVANRDRMYNSSVIVSTEGFREFASLTDSGAGSVAGPIGTALTAFAPTSASGLPGSQHVYVLPLAVLGECDEEIPVWAGWGDSNMMMANYDGVATNADPGAAHNPGPFGRAFAEMNVPFVNLGVASDHAQYNVERTGFFRRMALLKYVSGVIHQHGINDLNGNRTVAQLQANVNARADLCAAMGIRNLISTLGPHTGDPNNLWTTGTGQTPGVSTTIEARRVEYNAWCRGAALTAGGGRFEACVDVAAYLESGPDSGQWAAPDTGNPEEVSPSLAISAATSTSITTDVKSSGTQIFGGHPTAFEANYFADMHIVFDTLGGSAPSPADKVRRIATYNATTGVFTFLAVSVVPTTADTFKVYRTLTFDGLHASGNGAKRAKAAVLEHRSLFEAL